MTGASAKTAVRSIRVALPFHLRTLAKIEGAEVTLEVAAPVTVRRVLDALEARYPMLAGTIREHGTGKRRAFMRIFACEEDWSHESLDAAVAGGGGFGTGAAADSWGDCRGS